MLRTFVQQLCEDVGDDKFSGVDGDKCPLEEGVYTKPVPSSLGDYGQVKVAA